MVKPNDRKEASFSHNVCHLVGNDLKVGLIQWQEYLIGFYQRSPDFQPQPFVRVKFVGSPLCCESFFYL